MSDTPPRPPRVNVPCPSTKAWLIIHLIVPLVPVLVAAFLRFIFGTQITWATFKIADLSLAMALVVAFARQSLLDTERVLDNDDKREDVSAAATLLILPFSFCLTSFGALESLDVIVNRTNQLSDAFTRAQWSAVFICIVAAIWVTLVQRSYKLKAKWS
jgi:hypothetical protein